jgi:hypothetical protein
VGQVRTAAELRNSSPKRGWDGALRVSQLSQIPAQAAPTTPDTGRDTDTCRTNGRGGGICTHGLFVPKQSRRTCPDLGEAIPGVSLPHLRKGSEWVALSRPGPEHVGPRFGPHDPSGEEEGYP